MTDPDPNRNGRRFLAPIVDGFIRPPTHVELIVSDHCNIACRQCNHLSPLMPKWNVRPDEAGRDLTRLAAVMKTNELRLIGGEPVLHPDLPAVIEAARKSGLSPFTKLVTNGTVLDRMANAAWDLLDCVEVSRYPGTGVDDALLERARERGDRHGTRVIEARYAEFRDTFFSRRNDDDSLVEQIFEACKIANLWACLAVYEGRVYRCPQSIYARSIAGRHFEDGFGIDVQPDFQERLRNFIEGSVPLESCRYCVGTNGRKQPHSLLPRKTWRTDLDRGVDDVLDRELLAASLVNNSPVDDCRVEHEAMAIDRHSFGEIWRSVLARLRHWGR